MAKGKVELYNRYPWSSILIYSGVTVLHFVLVGLGIMLGYDSLFGYVLGGVYLVFAFGEMYILMPLTVCPNCVYYKLENSLCISGLNVVSRKLAGAGDIKKFANRARGPFCSNNLYIASMVIPIIVMIPALIINFSFVVLVLLLIIVALLIFRFFVIFSKIACLHCRAKNICPQAQSMKLDARLERSEMKTSYIADAGNFLARAGDVLAKDEARYGLIFGIARRLVKNSHFYGPDDPWFYVLEEGTELRAVAMRTPPFGVLLAHFSGDTVSMAKLLADSVSQFSPIVPSAVGESSITDPFAENWCCLNNVKVVDRMSLLMYRLDAVNDVKLAPGKFRLAGVDDGSLVDEWAHAFHHELYTSADRNQPEVSLADRIENNDVFLWEDDGPVSMAVKSRPTGKGISVSGVYTPPGYRQKGYATSCVTSLCRKILDDGYEFCTLYTDQANPVSNSIYIRIGFREICDSVMYTFSKPGD